MKKALRIAALVLAAGTSLAMAQSAERPKPPGTKPLQELPPPPALPPAQPGDKDVLEPQVTKRQEGPNTIEEYRIHGKLYMMKVTPPHGHPYILMDNKGDGTFLRQDNPLDNGVRVPQWVLMEF